MKYQDLPYYKNVLRGMAWLDEHYDGWLNKIELDELDMNYDFRSPDHGCDILVQLGEENYGIQSSTHLGMYAPAGCDELTKTWTALIELRRKLSKIPDGTVFVGQGPLPEAYQEHNSFYASCFEGVKYPSWDPKPLGQGSEQYCCYAAKPEHPIVTEWLFEGEPKMSNNKRYMINSYGSVSFAGYNATPHEIEQLRKAVKLVLSHNEYSAAPMNGIDGYSMTFYAHPDSEIRIGCQTITLREFKEFIDEYDRGEWKEPECEYDLGDKFLYSDQTYILANVDNGSYNLINTTTGERMFSEPVNKLPVTLNMLNDHTYSISGITPKE